MFGNVHMIFFVLLVGTAFLYGIFSLPTLTSGGTAGSSGITQAEFEAVLVTERTFCLKQPENIDCQCFANLSGAVQAHNAPRVSGAYYADKQQLARGQASRTC